MQREVAANDAERHDPVQTLARQLYRTCGLQGALAYARQEHMAGVVAALLALDAEALAPAA